MHLTPQQAVAITTEGRALLVEAGAGTGKTAVLVERFLHLLERHADWPIESIVAVTFTEKATREMRSRIRTQVEQRAAAEGPDSAWQARRRELDRLAVSTIHGLCARILRENAIAAGIDPRFSVLEEQDTVLLREQAVRQALANLAAGIQPRGGGEHDPFDLLASFETRDLNEEMMRLLGQRGTVDRLFARLPHAEQLLDEWRAGVCAMQREIWDQTLAVHTEMQEALEQLAGLAILHPTDRLTEHVLAAQEGCQCAVEGDLCAAAACFGRIKVNVGSAKAWGGKQGLDQVKAWLKAVRDLGACLSGKGYDQQIGPDDVRAAEALQCWRVLWDYISAIYDDLKEQARALDFDDLERLAHRLLTGRPRDIRVQATIDGIRHLMVDEFQDVNEVQGDILMALADLSAGGKFFAVGDAKQSIYRFRQAQVKVFNGVARAVQDQTSHGPLPLNRSFRTHAALVAALNDVFERVLQPVGATHAEFEARPGPLEPMRPPLPPGAAAPGCVEMVALPDGLADAIRRMEAAVLARRLHRLVAEAFYVWDRDRELLRPVNYGDIAILFRATTALPLYEEVFKAEGLPYLTVSGRGYYDRPEVRDLTALLACLQDPADDLSLAAVLRSPMFSLSDETLYRLRWFDSRGQPCEATVPFAQSLHNALETAPECAQPDRVRAAAQTLAKLWAAAGRVDVWSLLRMALDCTGYEATLALADLEATTRTSAGGGRGRANVAKFLQLARDQGGANLSAFLQSVQDLRMREAREGEALPDSPDAGAVQLMTVHAAKGLEFPVVVLADMGRGPHRSGQSAHILHDPMFGLACQVRDAEGEWSRPISYRRAEWLDGRMEEAESNRLLYVACTRAADLLILSGGLKAKTSWLRTLADGWGLQLGSQDEGDAPAEEVIDGGAYRLRILRPDLTEEESPGREAVGPAIPTSEAALMLAPALAQPLALQGTRWPVAVTHLPRVEEDDDEPRLRPIVRTDEVGARGGRPWRFLVGNLAHRALADWDCLQRADSDLQELLARWARRGGLFEPHDVQAAVARVGRMVDRLRTTALYREICAATERYTEAPLSICAGEQMLHGILDMLYRDRHGEWRLLDWKTEPVVKGQTLAEAAAPYLRQMAVYSRATEQILNLRVRAAICFLSAGAAVYYPEPSDLEREWLALSAER